MHFFAQGELHCDNTATYPLDKRLELWPKMKKADKKGVIKYLVVQSQLTPNHSSKHINFVKKRRPHYSIIWAIFHHLGYKTKSFPVKINSNFFSDLVLHK